MENFLIEPFEPALFDDSYTYKLAINTRAGLRYIDYNLQLTSQPVEWKFVRISPAGYRYTIANPYTEEKMHITEEVVSDQTNKLVLSNSNPTRWWFKPLGGNMYNIQTADFTPYFVIGSSGNGVYASTEINYLQANIIITKGRKVSEIVKVKLQTKEENHNSGLTNQELAIILGITIPIGVILILAVGYFIMKKVKKSRK